MFVGTRWCFVTLAALGLAASLINVAGSAGEYPLEVRTTLDYLMELPANLAASGCQNFGDTVLARELARQTGVKCKYLHPPEGKSREMIELLAASAQLPDIMERDWAADPGGPQAALANQTILRLNKVIKKDAPNLRGWLQSHPEWDRQVKTDDGQYYVFPCIRADERLLVNSGPVIRRDWLDGLRLAVPETSEEWYVVLKAFKDKKKALAPLSMTLTQLQTDLGGGFDVCGEQQGFYVEAGTVNYSFNTQQYKRFLLTLNRWFAEGLLDSAFANLTLKSREANFYSGKSGIVDVAVGGLGTWLSAMRKSDPKIQIAGLKYVPAKKGGMAKFARRLPEYAGNGGGNAAISGTCKNVAVAARLLDYNYSEAGLMLLNFGLESISYKWVNGYPKFTETVLKNSQGSSVKGLSQYTRSNFTGPMLLDGRAMEQYYYLPQQKEAQKQWLANDYQQYQLPVLTLTEIESEQIGPILSALHDYVTRMSISFIMGIEPLGNYEAYQDQIERLGIDRVLRVYQKAYDRYLQR